MARRYAAPSTGPEARVLHMVSDSSSAQNLLLGARAVDEKSSEITAILELLDLLARNRPGA